MLLSGHTATQNEVFLLRRNGILKKYLNKTPGGPAGCLLGNQFLELTQLVSSSPARLQSSQADLTLAPDQIPVPALVLSLLLTSEVVVMFFIL